MIDSVWHADDNVKDIIWCVNGKKYKFLLFLFQIAMFSEAHGVNMHIINTIKLLLFNT